MAFSGGNSKNIIQTVICFLLRLSIPGSSDSEDVYEMLMRNFNRAYSGNTRAPFGLYMHAAWFFGQDFRFERQFSQNYYGHSRPT